VHFVTFAIFRAKFEALIAFSAAALLHSELGHIQNQLDTFTLTVLLY
jgi:hypothetical protein